MNKALAFFMGTDCGGGRCEKCEGVFVQPRGMPLNPNPPSLGEGVFRGFSGFCLLRPLPALLFTYTITWLVHAGISPSLRRESLSERDLGEKYVPFELFTNVPLLFALCNSLLHATP